jgi:Trypsin
LRSLALLAALLVLAVTPSALGTARIVGGTPVDVRSAPWGVLVLHRSGGSGTLCSGAIIDPLHVLTAAHCVHEANGALVTAASLTIRAGVTNAAAPSPTDRPQDRGVQSFRVHPGYVDGDRSGGDDVAVLTLTSALDLSGPTARAIALPGPALRVKIGSAVTLAGFGLKTYGGTIDGTLNGMNGTLVDQGDCLRPEDDRSNAVLLCAYSGSSSPCGGDSGGALVLNAATPVVVGVTRAAACSSDSSASFANVTAPEILQFIQGNDDPPRAPRPTGPTTLERPTPVPQVGQTVRCAPGGWTGTPSLSFVFREGVTGSVISSGSPTRVLRYRDAGRPIFCRVIASNAGGTGFDESAVTAAPVQNAPDLSIGPATARRGGAAVVGVRLVDWVRPIGAVTICVKLAPRIGGKACRRVSPSGAEPAPVVFRLAVKSSAPLVRARARVTARAADGRSARRTGLVQIRG